MASNSEKTAWIVGATGGIGRCLVQRLTNQSWNIIPSARDEDRLQELVDEYDLEDPVPMDATDPKQVEKAAAGIFEKYDKLDGLVHLGGSFMLKGAHQLSLEEWKDTIDKNLNSAFYLLHYTIAPIQKQGFGSVVFTSTVAAQTGLPSHEAIAAAKAGIDGLVRSAAATYASRNIRVNSVAPGMTETPMSKPILSNETSRKITERMHPLGRVGNPEEVSSAYAWLLSDDSSWVTGQTISMDGGLSKAHPRPKV